LELVSDLKTVKASGFVTFARQLRAEDVRSHRGRVIDKGSLYRILRNRVYIGHAVHMGGISPWPSPEDNRTRRLWRA